MSHQARIVRTRTIPTFVRIAVFVAVLTVVTLGTIWFTRDTPQKAVQRYFEALKAYPATMEKVAATVTNPPGPGAEADSPSGDFQVTAMTSSGNHVTVRYVFQGALIPEHEEQVELETRWSGTEYKVVDGYPSLTIHSDLPVWIGSTEVTGSPMKLRPGGYLLSTRIAGAEVVDNPVFLRPGEVRTIELTQRLSPSEQDLMRSLVSDAFRTCLLREVAAPLGCPFGVDPPKDQRAGSTGRWVKSPRPDVTEDDVTVERDQSPRRACAVVTAQLVYRYPATSGGSRATETSIGEKDLPVTRERFVGCVDLTRRTSSSPTEVSWR